MRRPTIGDLSLALGVLAALAALVLAPHAARQSASFTWRPFALVAGLLIIGAVAHDDGLFDRAASALVRAPGGQTGQYVAAMLLVAAVTALLNLDTSVAFLTPVLVYAARSRNADEQRLLYGCVFMSNAASLLLPGSNLTNLLVLADEHINGSRFVARMAAPWTAAVLVTIVVTAIAFRRRAAHPSNGVRLPQARRTGALGTAAVAAALSLVLTLRDPAPFVLAVGLAAAVVRIAQRRIHVGDIAAAVDAKPLAGIFLIATALGAVARAWPYPAAVMAHAGRIETAAIGGGAAVLLNNLPAAVLLGSRLPAHPRSLLFGLNIGPNLAVTGSLSALIWWRTAELSGARPSVRTYTAVGVVLAPVTIAAVLSVAALTRRVGL